MTAYGAATRLAGLLVEPLARGIGGDWAARAGRLPADAGRGGVWLHGASVGEITSALPLARALARQLPVFVTANTTTGRAAAAAAGFPASLAPLDLPGALARFLDGLAPRVAVAVESELWPNRSAALARRGVPQVLVGGRMSARSAARWGHLRGLVAPVLGRLSAASAQDAASEARLLDLGLPPQALLGRVNLKLGAALARPVLPRPATRMRTLLAASTHEGEDEAILAAVTGLRERGLRLIVAPRHPRRFDAVARLMAGRGMAPARRSQGGDAGAPVLLADSMGEMDLWYAAAAMVFVGGSLVGRGGHTPWEPAAQGCAILHGPRVGNFTDDYARLDGEGAAVAVDAGSLARQVGALLGDPAQAEARGRRARAALEAAAGDAGLLVEAITRLAEAPLLP